MAFVVVVHLNSALNDTELAVDKFKLIIIEGFKLHFLIYRKAYYKN